VAPPPVQGEASSRSDLAALPRTLRDAIALLDRSPHARGLLGEGFVDHYLVTRDWECRQYERAVTEWELERYFEAV
jgi:glutamine synthetase